LFGFCSNDPINLIDLLGLASLTEVEDGDLFYTWNLGWIDKSHAGRDKKFDGTLKKAWDKLSGAGPGDTISLSIQLAQAGKKVDLTFNVKVAENREDRANQLLWMWQTVSERFEDEQNTGPQKYDWMNLKYGYFLKNQRDKQPSGRSTEDFVSNLIRFYAIVEDRIPAELIGEVAEPVVKPEWALEKQSAVTVSSTRWVSSYIWRSELLKCRPESASWEAEYIDFMSAINGPRLVNGNKARLGILPGGKPQVTAVTLGDLGLLSRFDLVKTGVNGPVPLAETIRMNAVFHRAFLEYGLPSMPELFMKYKPSKNGVSVAE